MLAGQAPPQPAYAYAPAPYAPRWSTRHGRCTSAACLCLWSSACVRTSALRHGYADTGIVARIARIWADMALGILPRVDTIALDMLWARGPATYARGTAGYARGAGLSRRALAVRLRHVHFADRSSNCTSHSAGRC